jgi:hypothetical protein
MADEQITLVFNSPEKDIEHAFSEDIITWQDALSRFHLFLREVGFTYLNLHEDAEGNLVFSKDPVEGSR